MKKGVMLLEVLVATAIGTLLLSFECFSLIKSANWYDKNIITLRDSAYSDEGLIILKKLIYTDMVQVNATDNKIVIATSDNKRKMISLSENAGKIMVHYYDSYDNYNNEYKAANVVAYNISSMVATKNGDLLYVTLVDKEGNRVSQCFGIKKVY